MRRIALFILILGVAAAGFGKDVYLSIGGSAGAFRTDMRIFNPSTTKDIQVQAYLLSGAGDNSGVTPKTITVPKRQMLVYDDVIVSLFQTTGLGGIRLSSADDFVATQRIYAVTDAGTLGQYVPGIDSTQAMKFGVIIQLKSNGGNGQKGTFRTNIGVLNPNNATANSVWRIYDKNNALIGAGTTMTLLPFAVVNPTELHSLFNVGTADLSDAWVSYASDQPLVAYGSVVDNGTTDPTYITAAVDSGVTSVPQTNGKVLSVLEKNGQIIVSGQAQLSINDVVTVQVQVTEGPHGFALLDPDGIDVIPEHGGTNPGTTYTETFTVKKQGTYSYFCTNTLCGAHTGMSGTFDIGQPTTGHPGY